MKLTRTLAPVIVLAIVSALGACSTLDEAAPLNSVAEETSEQLSTPFGSKLPEGITSGSNEAIAWEALMGPGGEYAAVAFYQAVLGQFGQVEPYASIKEAEERHIEALTRQLTRYNIIVPANPYLGLN